MGSSAPDDPRGRAADGAGAPGAARDLVAQAVAELYGGDPQDFTDRRKALAAAAKAAGDAASARRIGALRKPTRAAWVVNRLARDDPDAPTRMASLGAALRAAEQAKDGPRLRELSAARGQFIDTLAGQALAGAGVADPPAGLREEVTATLTAALADPEVAAEFAAGTLTRAAEWAGFGFVSPGGSTPPVTPPLGGTARPPEPPWPPRPTSLEEGRRRREAERRGKEGAAEEGRLRRERVAEERAALLAAQAAEEAAQAAARRQKIFADTERAVVNATAATADAVATEDRLEEEVRRLEERLTQARAELAETRLRARRAEIAERKARQALDRLPPPDEPQRRG